MLIGTSPAITTLRALIAKAALSPLPVLVEGPTGAGKELVAESLHALSRRRGAFVAVNACAISEGLFESEIFGHTRGAFTGALGDRDGYLTEAHDGTFFLDEIASLPIGLQAKLLRVVETKRFRPLGARSDRSSNFRLIAATNRRLSALVEEGSFREDLAHRLSGLTLRVPPLRERIEDVAPLALHFGQQFGTRGGRAVTLSDSALSALEDYSWPGNVRELRATIEVAITMSDRRELTADDVRIHLEERRAASISSLAQEQERRELCTLLRECHGDPLAMAKALGVDRGTVYRRLKQLGIATPRQRRDRSGTDPVSHLARETSLS